jgi:hypothetical protein
MEITLSELEEVLDRRFKASKSDFEEVLEKRFSNNKQEFEQVLDKRFGAFGQEMDRKLSHFVTREEFGSILDEKFADVITEMKAFTEDQIESLALNIQETIAIPLQELKQQQKIAA